MAEIRSAEAQRIVQRLLKELSDSKTIESQTSTNSLKKIRRGLGALLFSPDYVGYIDVIDNKMRKGETPKQILSSIASRSEKLVKSYSPIPGLFEAHHVIALNSLRDSFMGLPPDEQDKFLKMLGDEGWEIGDSPKQLMDTVLTRMAHVGQNIKAATPAEVGTITGDVKTAGQQISGKGFQHAHSERVYARQASSAEELVDIFNTEIAPNSISLAQTGLIQDRKLRAFMRERGFPIDQLTPEILNEYYQDPLKTRGLFQTVTEGLGEFEAGGVDKTVIQETKDQFIQEAGPRVRTDPDAVRQTSNWLIIDGLGPLKDATLNGAKNALIGKTNAGRLTRLVGAATLPGLLTLPASAKAFDEARQAREQDPSLRNRALEIATGMQVAGDTLDVSGTALTATGAGAPVGIPMAAVGGGISNVGAVAEQVITAPEAYQRSTETVSERTGKTEEKVRADPLGYGALFNTVKDKLGQIGLSGFNPMQSAFN